MLPVVTATAFNERKSTDQLLLGAVVVSLLIHLTFFGLWKWGQKEGWWLRLHFPAWTHLTPKLISPITPKKLSLAPKPEPQPSQMIFVDVDPSLAEAAPPKAPKFYSANNSIAANPSPKTAVVPEIHGSQTKVMKTTPNAQLKPKPLEPSPPQKEIAKPAEAKPLPQKAYVPGDLVMAKPRDKPQEKDGKAETVAAETPQQPVHQRPRTIAEAMAQKGMLGEKTRQDGGVKQLKMDSSLDAMKTSYGDYDREFIDAVRTRWYQLLENRSTGSGKVVVEFRMLPDGRITNLKIAQNEVNELLGIICQQAIDDPAPYRPWPEEMRRDIGKDYRDVTFTFFYSTE